MKGGRGGSVLGIREEAKDREARAFDELKFIQGDHHLMVMVMNPAGTPTPARPTSVELSIKGSVGPPPAEDGWESGVGRGRVEFLMTGWIG